MARLSEEGGEKPLAFSLLPWAEAAARLCQSPTYLEVNRKAGKNCKEGKNQYEKAGQGHIAKSNLC